MKISMAMWIGIGLVVGITVGVILDNIGLGVALGLIVGVVIDRMQAAKAEKEHSLIINQGASHEK